MVYAVALHVCLRITFVSLAPKLAGEQAEPNGVQDDPHGDDYAPSHAPSERGAPVSTKLPFTGQAEPRHCPPHCDGTEAEDPVCDVTDSPPLLAAPRAAGADEVDEEAERDLRQDEGEERDGRFLAVSRLQEGSCLRGAECQQDEG